MGNHEPSMLDTAQLETHVMLSEEEEEEDESDQDKVLGAHLHQAPDKSKARTQVFSGSSDEWTDQRIQQFQARIERSRLGIEPAENRDEAELTQKQGGKSNMIQYETFESSSGDEMSRCLFESQARSFQNKDKVVSSKEKE